MDRFFTEFEIDESCRPKEWPRIPENGIPYSTDLVGWLSPIVVYGEIYQNPLTKLSAIRVKERRTFFKDLVFGQKRIQNRQIFQIKLD